MCQAPVYYLLLAACVVDTDLIISIIPSDVQVPVWLAQNGPA